MFTFVRLSFTIGGIICFYYLAGYFNLIFAPGEVLELRNRIGFMLAGGLTGYLFSPYIYNYSREINRKIELTFKTISPYRIASGVFGLIIGLMIANLSTLPIHLFLKEYSVIGLFLSVIGCIVFGYLGIILFMILALHLINLQILY